MILVIIRMKVPAEKRMELSQTIALLIDSIKTEKGCRRCDFYRSMEDENKLCIFEEWSTRESLNRHLKSERFMILRGAMNLLQEPYQLVRYTVTAGRKKTKAGGKVSMNFHLERQCKDEKRAGKVQKKIG